MLETIPAPPVHVTTVLGSPGVPTLYEIHWRDGRVSGPFVSPELAAEYAIDSWSWHSLGRLEWDDGRDLLVTRDRDGRTVEGEIVECGRAA